MNVFVLAMVFFLADGSSVGATGFFKTEAACAAARDRDAPKIASDTDGVVGYVAACGRMVSAKAKRAL